MMPAFVAHRKAWFLVASAALVMGLNASMAISAGTPPPAAALRPPPQCLFPDGPGGFGPSNWACQVEAPLAYGVPISPPSGNSTVPSPGPATPIRELSQITIPASCGPISGTLFHETGEACDLAISDGSLSLDKNGIGTLVLTIDIGNTEDENNDQPCSALFGGQTSITENFHVILSGPKGDMLLTGAENFIAPSEGAAALVPVSGHCIRQ
jgi:hypothetical protein